jgi:hypothetical protein
MAGETIKYAARHLIKAGTRAHNIKTIVTKGELSYEFDFDTKAHIVVDVEHSLIADDYRLFVGYRKSPDESAMQIFTKAVPRGEYEHPLNANEVEHICAQIKILGDSSDYRW